jgi:hypothetical protein
VNIILLNVILLNVILLNIILLKVILLNAILLKFTAPFFNSFIRKTFKIAAFKLLSSLLIITGNSLIIMGVTRSNAILISVMLLNVILLNVILLYIILLKVILLNAILLNFTAPQLFYKKDIQDSRIQDVIDLLITGNSVVILVVTLPNALLLNFMAPQLLPGVKQSGHRLPALLGREEQDPLGPEAAEHDVQADYHRRQEGQQLGQAGGKVLKLFLRQ